jgi:hypothetical protein
MIDHLNAVNDITIYSVYDEEFKTFGRIVKGYDFSSAIKFMKENTSIPQSGNIYFPSIKELEEDKVFKDIKKTLYGDMDIQIGYCNGVNSTYNGFEYHKGSEINVAVTPFMLVLGHIWDIEDNKYYIGKEKVFFVPEGTVIEMYQTTLHLSPCKVSDEGFKDIVILPRGTNTKLDEKIINEDIESKILLQRNKWVIAHKDREPLIKQGAVPGLIGDNKELKY